MVLSRHRCRGNQLGKKVSSSIFSREVFTSHHIFFICILLKGRCITNILFCGEWNGMFLNCLIQKSNSLQLFNEKDITYNSFCFSAWTGIIKNSPSSDAPKPPLPLLHVTINAKSFSFILTGLDLESFRMLALSIIAAVTFPGGPYPPFLLKRVSITSRS